MHLSANQATAMKVGQHHGRPVILEVQSAQMHRDGLLFYLSANGAWLTDYVPAKYLVF